MIGDQIFAAAFCSGEEGEALHSVVDKLAVLKGGEVPAECGNQSHLPTTNPREPRDNDVRLTPSVLHSKLKRAFQVPRIRLLISRNEPSHMHSVLLSAQAQHTHSRFKPARAQTNLHFACANRSRHLGHWVRPGQVQRPDQPSDGGLPLLNPSTCACQNWQANSASVKVEQDSGRRA